MKDLDIVSLQNLCREWRHKCHQPNNSETDWEKFRYYRNKLKKSIKTTKKQFYRKALQSKKTKEVWSIIHGILSPNQKKITSSPEKLNSYYVNLAETLTGKQSATPTELNEIINNLPSTNKDSFVLKTVTYQQVLNEINSIRNDCSTGCDNLPINLFKPLAETIAFPMTTIINDCIRKCIFPEQWKVAKVCPIPKVHNPSQSKDYRPISILPIFSKILERVIMKQLCLFIEDQVVYSKNQSGFRKNHSTNTLLIKMRDDILNAQDRGAVTIAVLTDFSKASDTVDFAALLQNLHKLNFSQEQRLQKVQNAAAAFVLNGYCTITDIVKLNWLLVRESVQMNLSNLCFKAVHFKNFPTYLSLQPAPKPRRPRSCNDRGFLIKKSGHKNFFRMRAVNIFNELPRQLRDIDGTQYTKFKKEARNYFLKV